MLNNFNTSEYKVCECGHTLFEEVREFLVEIKNIKENPDKKEPDKLIPNQIVYKCSKCGIRYKIDPKTQKFVKE